MRGALRANTHIGVAGPGNLTDLGELLAHFLGVGHQSLGGQRLDVLGDLGPGLGVSVGPAPALGLMAGLHVPGAVGIIGTRPALGVVPRITQWVKEFFVPGWGNIQRPPGRQLDARGDGVDMRRAGVVTVQHGAGGVLIGSKPGECGTFPLRDNGIYIGEGGIVIRRPGDHPAGVAPLVRAAVGDLGNQVRVTAQYGDLGATFTVVVTLLEEIAHRAGSTPLAMAQKLDMHAMPPRPGRHRHSTATRRAGAARAGWRRARRAAARDRRV